jgi:hypothetical protein
MALLLTALAASAVWCASRGSSRPRGFEPLFDGHSLVGWRGQPGDPPDISRMTRSQRNVAVALADQRAADHWRALNGILFFDGHPDAGNLCTIEHFGDFELIVDWKLPSGGGGDSGIYLRASPQVQIWDARNDPPATLVGSGGLYNNRGHTSIPLTNADHPPGQWNRFHITMRGSIVTVYLNGVLVVDRVPFEDYWANKAAGDDVYVGKLIAPRGPIELQAHGSPTWFRNILIKRLEPRMNTDGHR